jgi:hypothetical protein
MKWGIFLSIVALAAAPVCAAHDQMRPFNYSFKNKYAEVSFSWSKEAAAVPALVKRFHAELLKAKADTIAGGKEDYALRKIGWESSTKVTTSGQSPRLLSLSREDWEFTGGAHGNGGTTGLLWDRRLNKEISFAALFSSASAYGSVLRPPYCRALDQERIKRRGGDGKLNNGIGEFDSCPKLSDLAIIPADSHHNRRFDEIHLIASPYLAGPYAEGEYDITLPVRQALIELMKPEYRSSFEAQRQ